MSISSQYIVLTIYALLLLVIIIFAVAMHLIISKHKIQNYQAKLLETTRLYEQELVKVKQELQEETFQIVSNEIHDSIGQIFVSVALTLQSLGLRKLDSDVREILTRSGIRLNEGISSLRNLSHMLNKDYLEKIGLIEAIKKEISYLKLNKNLKVDFVDPEKLTIPPLTGPYVVMMFRITQEAIQNALRHSRASVLQIALDYQTSSRQLSLSIIDNGIGVSDSDPGFGMHTMQARAKLINGKLNVDQPPGGGSKIHLTVQL